MTEDTKPTEQDFSSKPEEKEQEIPEKSTSKLFNTAPFGYLNRKAP